MRTGLPPRHGTDAGADVVRGLRGENVKSTPALLLSSPRGDRKLPDWELQPRWLLMPDISLGRPKPHRIRLLLPF